MIGAQVGSYRIVKKIGAGGMGVVYLAEHTLIGRKAAIKLLLPEFSRDEASLARFFNEARSTALIRHGGLVDVFDFGQHEGAAYIAMELLDGESLAARLGREERIEVGLAAALARQVAAAVGAAHAQGIVHRDLKPDNVFLVPDAAVACGLRVKVLDFGIAKLGGELGAVARTTTGNLLGTPLYMSPEQCRGAGAVDFRADIYSLGCMLYEMLAGEPPFLLPGMGELISAHLNDTPVRLGRRATGLPEGMEALVMGMLAKRPDARPQSMEEVDASLRRVAAGEGPSVVAAMPTVVSVDEPRPAVALSAARTMPSGVNTTLGRSASEVMGGARGRLPWWWIAGGAAAVAAAALVWVLARGTREARPRETALPVASRPASPAPTAPTVIVNPLLPKVKLHFESVPSGAEVFRVFDGVRLGVTPLDVELAAAPGTASFQLRRSSYQLKTVTLATDQDGSVKVILTRKPNKTSGSGTIGDGVLDE